MAHHLALGGGAGLAHWLIRLFIWHEIFRLIRYVWRVPTVGPFLVVVIIVGVVGFFVWRQQRGPFRRGARRGSSGYGTGSGPRDW
jgi:hypothetical protein